MTNPAPSLPHTAEAITQHFAWLNFTDSIGHPLVNNVFFQQLVQRAVSIPSADPTYTGLRPLGDRVVIRPAPEPETSAGGIILPKADEPDKPRQGEVIAVGPGAPLKSGGTAPMQTQVGDVVVFGRFAPSEFTVAGEDLLVISEKEILAVLESAPAQVCQAEQAADGVQGVTSA